MTNYYNPVKVIETDNWLNELQTQSGILNIKNPLIISSSGNKKRLNLETIYNTNSIIDIISSNPDFNDCDRLIDFCKNKNFDSIIAIGGGSTMDIAKVAMAYLCLNENNIKKLIEYNGNYPKIMPSIFVPTTHGTGSEVTMWGTVWNMVEKKKYSISHPSLYPAIAILDGNLSLSLPLDISITTILDALSHSFEAIWNNNSNKKSTDYAIKAISLILKNVDLLKQDPSNIFVRNKLLLASTTAGLAFSNTKTSAAHSISYPLTIYFGIPHGVASSISLIPLLEINKKSIKDALNIICNNNSINYQQLKEKIVSIPKDVIPTNLRGWGVKEKSLDLIAESSFTERMKNNSVKLSINDVKKILYSIY